MRAWPAMMMRHFAGWWGRNSPGLWGIGLGYILRHSTCWSRPSSSYRRTASELTSEVTWQSFLTLADHGGNVLSASVLGQ